MARESHENMKDDRESEVLKQAFSCPGFVSSNLRIKRKNLYL